MPATTRLHGTLRDGRAAHRVTLSSGDEGLTVEVLDYGASLHAIRWRDGRGEARNLVLSYDSLQDYETGDAYLGATIGRCAGRTLVADGTDLPLTRNEDANHLHGGQVGFSHSLWKIVEVTDGATPSVRLQHHAPDGEDGYPGNLVVDIEFRLVSPFSLQVTIEASSDAATPLNMTLHPYFNLNGDPSSSVENHELQIAASRFLPLDARRIPTGDVLGVERTPFDFRAARRVGDDVDGEHPQLRLAGGFDHYWVLDDDARIAADVYSPATCIGLRVQTDQKGLQFYAGNSLHRTSPAAFAARRGFCIEPQDYPNAINEPRFADITLGVGDTYRYRTCYEFYARTPEGSSTSPTADEPARTPPQRVQTSI